MCSRENEKQELHYGNNSPCMEDIRLFVIKNSTTFERFCNKSSTAVRPLFRCS